MVEVSTFDIIESSMLNEVRHVWSPLLPYEEKKNWCKENLKQDSWNFYGYYQRTPCVFRFENPEDALAFKLRFNL